MGSIEPHNTPHTGRENEETPGCSSPDSRSQSPYHL